MESTRTCLPARHRHTEPRGAGQVGAFAPQVEFPSSSLAKTRNLRIAYIVTRADEIGGAQVHVRDLASAMHAAGHELIVLAGITGAPFFRLAAARALLTETAVRGAAPALDMAVILGWRVDLGMAAAPGAARTENASLADPWNIRGPARRRRACAKNLV
jgi:hypothetical protein